MSKQYAPHEPEEEVLSVEDAFRDAECSEARWRAFERGEYLRRVLIELPEPAYLTLEELARRQKQTVPRLIERVITYSDADKNAYTHQDSNKNAYRHSSPYSYSDTNQNANSHTHWNSAPYSYLDADEHTDNDPRPSSRCRS